MGWTYFYKHPDNSLLRTLKDEFEMGADGELKYEILDCAVVHMRTAYLAVKRLSTGKVFAVVCLLSYRPKDMYNFGYKEMDESMNPYYYDCPDRIMNLLTPAEDDGSIKWRRTVQLTKETKVSNKRNQPKLKVGDTVTFSTPVNFTKGRGTEYKFKVISLKPKLFQGINNTIVCRITKGMLEQAKVS